MMNQQELENNLAATLNGNWQAREKITYYFKLDERLHRPADPQKEAQKQVAFQYVSNAADKGNPYAIAYLGTFYETGRGVEKNINRAVELYRTAAEKYNNSWGQTWYGMCFRDGGGVLKNSKKAIELFQLAVNQNYPPAMTSLGWMLGQENKTKERDELYRTAAKLGNSWALQQLCYKGWGNPFDIYIPTNKEIKCSYTENKELRVNFASSYHAIVSYTVTVEYTGPVNIGDRIILKETIPNDYQTIRQDKLKDKNVRLTAEERAKYSFGKIAGWILFCPLYGCLQLAENPCCDPDKKLLFKDDDDYNKIKDELAEGIATDISSVNYEENVARMIEKADGLITQRIQKSQNYMPQMQTPQSGGGIQLTPEQFKIWMEAQNLKNSSQAVSGQAAEGQPLLSQYQPPSAPPQYGNPPAARQSFEIAATYGTRN